MAEEKSKIKRQSIELGLGANMILPFAHLRYSYRLPVPDDRLDIFLDHTFYTAAAEETNWQQVTLVGAKFYFEKFENIWCHGDLAKITKNHGLTIYGRSDATLNPGGVRIGTAEIYRQVDNMPEVIESIAIGQDWDNDVRVVLFVVLSNNQTLDEVLIKKIKTTIRTNTTPRHAPAKVIQVTAIPKTLSGKIVEIAVRKIIHNRPVNNTDALANPEALEQYKDLKELTT